MCKLLQNLKASGFRSEYFQNYFLYLELCQVCKTWKISLASNDR